MLRLSQQKVRSTHYYYYPGDTYREYKKKGYLKNGGSRNDQERARCTRVHGDIITVNTVLYYVSVRFILICGVLAPHEYYVTWKGAHVRRTFTRRYNMPTDM